MSEYWKSTGKWYCELCKCWTGDNKASREFHERGKKHAEAKKRRIIEAKRDAIGKRKQDEKDAGMFAKMEAEALKAVQKDVAAGLTGRGDMKKIVQAHSGEGDTNCGIDTYPWTAMDTPQGFKYYYNSLTGESTWIVPDVFKKVEEEKKKRESAAVIKAEQATTSSATNVSDNSQKETCMVQQHDVHPLLGGWSTVTHHSRPLEPVQNESETSREADERTNNEKSEALATTDGSEQTAEGESVPPSRETGKKFKEKVLKTTLTSSTTDESEPVMFKKRKSGSKNVRKRTSDD